jgi:hypothetical protein
MAVTIERLGDATRPKCNSEYVMPYLQPIFFLYAKCNNRIKTDGV